MFGEYYKTEWGGWRASAMVQVVKVLTLHARDPIWALVLSQQPHFPSSSLSVARESSQGQPKALGPCTHMGNPEEAPGFRSA